MPLYIINMPYLTNDDGDATPLEAVVCANDSRQAADLWLAEQVQEEFYGLRIWDASHRRCYIECGELPHPDTLAGAPVGMVLPSYIRHRITPDDVLAALASKGLTLAHLEFAHGGHLGDDAE